MILASSRQFSKHFIATATAALAFFQAGAMISPSILPSDANVVNAAETPKANQAAPAKDTTQEVGTDPASLQARLKKVMDMTLTCMPKNFWT